MKKFITNIIIIEVDIIKLRLLMITLTLSIKRIQSKHLYFCKEQIFGLKKVYDIVYDIILKTKKHLFWLTKESNFNEDLSH